MAKNKDVPVCRCGQSMVLRTARQGSRMGEDFWGCSNPNCKEAINASATRDSAKKVYEKPQIVDIEKLISETFDAFRETAEHVARERCPSGCKVVADRVRDKDSSRVRVLLLFSFKLGGWSFDHRETWILWDPNQSVSGHSRASKQEAQRELDRSLNLLFDRAARDLMKFHSRKESGR